MSGAGRHQVHKDRYSKTISHDTDDDEYLEETYEKEEEVVIEQQRVARSTNRVPKGTSRLHSTIGLEG